MKDIFYVPFLLLLGFIFLANFLLKISLRKNNNKLDNIEIIDSKSLNFLLTQNCAGNMKPETEEDISDPPDVTVECELDSDNSAKALFRMTVDSFSVTLQDQ